VVVEVVVVLPWVLVVEVGRELALTSLLLLLLLRGEGVAKQRIDEEVGEEANEQHL
jgi:hypothetical protein